MKISPIVIGTGFIPLFSFKKDFNRWTIQVFFKENYRKNLNFIYVFLIYKQVYNRFTFYNSLQHDTLQ